MAAAAASSASSASSTSCPIQIVGVANSEQNFSNCCFVHPSNFDQLATQAGVDPAKAFERGILCAINNSCVFFVKPYADQAPYTLAVGLFQRITGCLQLGKSYQIVPFRLPAGHNFSLASITIEVSFLTSATTSIDNEEFVEFLHNTLHEHVVKVGSTIPIRFHEVGLKILVKAMTYEGDAELDTSIGDSCIGQFVRTTVIELIPM